MKVTRLDLVRYGHFTGGVVAFAADPGVITVVLANNAAGKTTALNALRDLLFGIPRHSPYRFLHDDDPRVGGEVVTAAGAVVRFERKKGDKRSLLDEHGRPLDAGVLQRCLGPVDRELFEKLFGLDHARLRSAGEELARGEGRLAEALLVAASGLRGLRDFGTRLAKEAEEILSPSGRAGALAHRLRELRDGEAALRSTLRTVSADGFQRLERALAEAQRNLAAQRERLAEEVRRKSALDRLQRTIPLLARLHETRSALAALGAMRTTDPDLQRQWEAAERRRVDAAAARQELLDRIAAHEAERAALQIDEGPIAAAADIVRLQEELGAARKARTDLPKREGEQRQQSAAIETLCRQVGLACAPDEALGRVPPRPARDEVRAAARELRDLAARLPHAERRRAETQVDLATQTERLAGLGAPVDVAPLRARLDALDKEGLVALLTDVEGRMQSALRRADQHAAGSRHWRGSAEELAALPLPERVVVERYRQTFDETAMALKDAAQRLKAVEEEERRIGAAVAALAETPLPTPERIAAARELRDATWAAIERRHVHGFPLAGDLAAKWNDLLGDEAPAAVFTGRVREADRLADERAEQAERVERYREYRRQQQACTERRAALAAEWEALRERDAARRKAWDDLWTPTAIAPGEPAEMLEWLVRCEEVRKRYEEGSGAAVTARRLRERLAGETAALTEQLGAAGGETPAPGGDVVRAFQSAVAAARAWVERCAAGAAQRTEVEERVESLRQEAGRAARDHERLDAQRRELTVRWERAMQGIGWPSTASVDEAEAVVGVYDAIEQQVPIWRETRHRIDRMRHDAADLAAASERLVAAAAPDLVGRDVFFAAGEMRSRLDAARSACAARDALDRALTEARRALDRIERKLRDAEAVRSDLLERLGVADDESARAELVRISTWQSLRARETELLGTLQAAGDGESLAALEQAAATRSIDEVRAELEGMAEAHAEAGAAMEAAVAAMRDLEAQRRQRLEAADTAVLAVQQEELRRACADAASRYAVIKTAETLLRQAIDRFRQESAGPQLARASDLFAHITGGAYERLFTDQDDAGVTLLRTRHRSGRVKSVPALSDGERDQLYLALRLAAIEDYAARAEPLPFVADDLLVHFDDPRAARTLETLRQLAEHVQVVFLTHHAHLVDLARATLGPTGLHLVALPEAGG